MELVYVDVTMSEQTFTAVTRRFHIVGEEKLAKTMAEMYIAAKYMDNWCNRSTPPEMGD